MKTVNFPLGGPRRCALLMAVLLMAVLLIGLSGAAPATAKGNRLLEPAFPLSVSLNHEGNPVLSWRDPDTRPLRSRMVLRSTSDLRVTKDSKTFPIAWLDAHGDPTGYCDREAPQDIKLSYQLRLEYENGDTVYSSVAMTKLPAPRIPVLERPSLYVDKLNYTLTLLDNGEAVRRFPIALGANPFGRKVHFDRASTPEGLYRISGLQPQAQFYRAFDLNYPNHVDRARYRVLADQGQLPDSEPGIGGEIQIHGSGIGDNWTWGCVALQDKDMDLLFSLPELCEGTWVVIAGSELTREDLESELYLSSDERDVYVQHLVDLRLASGRSDKHWTYALCKFQAEQGLKVTGIFDRSTRKAMERQLGLSSLPAEP